MGPDPWNDAELSLAAAQHVDEICRQFEHQLSMRSRPLIEWFLADTTGIYRRALLRELMALEVQHRLRQRDQLAREDLHQRFPQDSDLVELVWEEALLAVARVHPTDGNTRRPAASLATSAQNSTHFAAEPFPRDILSSISPAQQAVAATARYDLRSFHACGGMGEVFIAEDHTLDRRVALKRLRSEGEHLRERFLAEAKITGQLEHPGIVPLYDLGHDSEGRPYYVMKFIEGTTLRKTIENYHQTSNGTAIDQDMRGVQLLQIFVQLCHTVAYAHSRGVIHRDLKPDNVMLGPYGETLLLDWGVAKLLSGKNESGGPSPGRLSPGESTATSAGSIVGSVLYISPEAAEGNVEKVNEQSDVYLLGATLYEILTGQPPRRGTSAAQVLELARTTDPKPPRLVRPGIPPALEAICLKALARRSTGRYSTAQELAEDVQRFLADEPVTAFREGVVRRYWRWCKRHRRQLGYALLVITCLLSFALAVAKSREAWHVQEMQRARQEVAKFRELADEVQFFAAHTDPATETTPYFDPGRALLTAKQVFATADAWGPALEKLPLVEERDRMREELYELCLLVIQASLTTGSSAKAHDELPALFRRAALLDRPTEAYWRLLEEAKDHLDPASLVQFRSMKAGEAIAPTTALDHFINGERARRRAVQYASPSDNSPWQWNQELLQEALREYDLALFHNSRHYWAHFQRGRCYLSLGRTAEAGEALGVCIALRPDAPWAYSTRGLAAALGGNSEAALTDLNRVITAQPTFLVARLNRGVVLWQMGKDSHQAALADFKAVLEVPANERLVEALFYRAQVALEHGDWQLAIADLDDALAARPQFRSALRLRVRVRLLHDTLAGGMADLNALLANTTPDWQPDSARACYERGRFLRRLAAPESSIRGRVLNDAAEQELRRALELGQETADLFEELGAAQDRQGRLDAARNAYTRGLQLDTAHVGLRALRGWLLTQKLNDLQQATADFSAILSAQPHNREAMLGLGYVAACQGDSESAEKYAMQAVLEGGAGDYLALHNAACIYAQLFRYSEPRNFVYAAKAIQLLRHDMELWRRGGKGLPNALDAILQDSSLSILSSHLEFKELLDAESDRKP
jgi:tetratricopeptide (TPR) repeat protein